jgi:hypothetical protein
MSVVLISSGCSVSLLKGYHVPENHSEKHPVSWFQADSGYFLFNGGIRLMKNHFTGLMVIKPMTGQSYRVIFLTEVGLKVFDMEFFPDGGKKNHYIMDALNRKAMLNRLSGDIRLVLMNGLSDRPFTVFTSRDSTDIIFRYRDKHRKNYYVVADAGHRPHYIMQTGCITGKVGVDLFGTSSGIDSVKITHNNLRLEIALYRIHDETGHVAE